MEKVRMVTEYIQVYSRGLPQYCTGGAYLPKIGHSSDERDTCQEAALAVEHTTER